MAKVERYPAQRAFQLDCGHKVGVGQTFVVTKIFTCEQHMETPVHSSLASIQETLERGVVFLKHLEWDLRHTK